MPPPHQLPDQLRAAIRKSGLTHYALGKLADVYPEAIDRFMEGRDIYLVSAGKLAASLGLTLGPKRRKNSAKKS